MPPSAPDTIELSLLAPAHNEQDNIQRLVNESGAALENAVGPGRYEFVIVDDGSTDQTRARIAALIPTRPWLRCVAMTGTPPGKGNGQSAAFYSGVRACRGRLIATLDADLQNDPADLKAMIELMKRENADLVQGDRSHARADNIVRKITSRIGRFFRNLILADAVRDTGCSLRVMKREIALQLPLQFKGMHRFIPITAVHLGYKVVEMPVHHRPRTAGETKYGFGIWQRAIPGLIDCFAVRWMSKRRRPTTSIEVGAADGAAR
jgi:glycosyltransferase involved in cell wall biosynthesis